MARNLVPPLKLERRGKVSLQQQLTSELRLSILNDSYDGSLPLPSSRELAKQLGVSRNTVNAAYEQLAGEGYLETRERFGIFIRSKVELPPGVMPPVSGRKMPEMAKRGGGLELAPPKPFRPSQVDVTLFPTAKWQRCRNKSFREFGTNILHYQSKLALGLPRLRKAIAEYLKASRGVRCDWTQVAITSGSQQALFIISQILGKQKRTLFMEDPGYASVVDAMKWANVKLQSLPVDESGAQLPKRITNRDAVYLTPSRQFPTGVAMPVARRLDFLRQFHLADGVIIEDDYDSEYRYEGSPLPSLHSLDSDERVLYVGSMSKVLFPSLRIGYMVLPGSWIDEVENLKRIIDDHGSFLDQATLAFFIESGDFYSHIRRTRRIYSQKLEAFLVAMDKHRAPFQFLNTKSGMNILGYFNDQTVNAEVVSRKLAEHGFDIPPLSNYSSKPTPAALFFGFTAFSIPTIQKSIASLCRLLT